MKPRLHHLQRLDRLGQPFFVQASRHVHTSKPHHASAVAAPTASHAPESISPSPSSTVKRPPPRPSALSILPFHTILRTYLITRMSSSPVLLNASLVALNRLLSSHFILTDVDRNPLLRWLLRKTFYAQFCAGETKTEVQRAARDIKSLGYSGVIFEYALEVMGNGVGGAAHDAESAKTTKEIEMWRMGMVETVEMCEDGDFIGLKWSGLGTHALHLLRNNLPPTPAMNSAIHEVCALAASKRVRLLPSAEEEVTNTGIDTWTQALQAHYNAHGAVVYSTYQAYLKSTPAKLAAHLAAARQGGFTAGVKLVRGAYLASEPRERIWETKERTDEVYDGLVEGVLRRRYGGALQAGSGEGSGAFPEVEVVLATHNAVSVERAQALRRRMAEAGEKKIRVGFAQLQGMADEVSCELMRGGEAQGLGKPEVYKCTAWGTTRQCLNYLLRRAEENKDAAGRTVETRKAMASEIWRRARGAVGLP